MQTIDCFRGQRALDSLIFLKIKLIKNKSSRGVTERSKNLSLYLGNIIKKQDHKHNRKCNHEH